VPDAQAQDWPGLEKISRCALRARRLDAAHLDPHGTAACSSTSRWSAARRRDDRYCFPDMLADVVRLSAKAGAMRRTTCSTPPALIRYEQQPGVGLAVRKYVLMRRGVIASEAQRKPARRSVPARAPRSTTCCCAWPRGLRARLA